MAGRMAGPAQDHLQRLLDDLCRPGALERRRDDRGLLEFVDAGEIGNVFCA